MRRQQIFKKIFQFYLTLLNTSYLIDSYIVFTLKMESVSINTIFGLKMMVKSVLEKFILKSLHAERWLFVLPSTYVTLL